MSKSELTALPVSSFITENMPLGLSLFICFGRVCDEEDSVECISAQNKDHAESIFRSLLVVRHENQYGSLGGELEVYVEAVKKLTEMEAIGLRASELA